jgi:hypothetical protein
MSIIIVSPFLLILYNYFIYFQQKDGINIKNLKGLIMAKTQQNIIDGLLVVLRAQGALNLADEIELKKEFSRSDSERFEDYLIDEGIVDKDDLLQALGKFYNRRPFDVMGAMLDHDLVTMFPKDVLLNNNCIPYRTEDDFMVIIAGDPSNEDLDAILGEYVSYNFEYYVGIPRHIDMMIKDFYNKELYEEDFEDIVEQEKHERETIHIDEDEGIAYLDEEGKDED